jgi:hypothetical protein
MKRNKVAALVICFLVGPIGIHFVYLGEYHRAKKRLIWFLLCNPVAFYNTLLDLGRIGFMSDYQFNAKYCNPKVEGTGSRTGLHEHINTLHKK